MVTGVGSVFMFHSRCFLEKTRLSPATTDTHCPLPTPPPGGCFAELIYPGCLAPPGRRKTGDRGAGVERPGLCRGRPAGARWQEHGKAPRSTPGPRAGRPRAGRGVGAREAAVCSLHCPPRPSATTAPSANVSVERRSHPHPPGKIREGRAAAEGGGGGVASHWRFFDHHFMPDQLPPRAPRAQESPCATPRTQPSSEAEEKAEVLSRYRGPALPAGRGAPTAPGAARASFAAPWKPARSRRSRGPWHFPRVSRAWSPLGAPSARPRASCRVLADGAGRSLGVPGLCCPAGAALATYLSRPSRSGCCPGCRARPRARRLPRGPPPPSPRSWARCGAVSRGPLAWVTVSR